MQQHGGADADGEASHGRDQRPIGSGESMEKTDHGRSEALAGSGGLREFLQVVARRKRPGHAGDDDAADCGIAIGVFQRGGHRAVHRGGQRVLLVRAVHPHHADPVAIGDRDVIAHAVSAASAALTLSEPSVTVRSRPEACTAMFSAKNRAMATRMAGSPSATRSAANASSASMQPPAALPNSRKYGVAPASAACGSASTLLKSHAVARSRLSTASPSRAPAAPNAGSF